MTLRTTLQTAGSQKEAGSFLIFWPNEDCVSCVKRCRIVGDECPSNGSLCQVKVGCKIYSGRVAASGEEHEMKTLEQKFLDGKYTPFAPDASSQTISAQQPASTPATCPDGSLPLPPTSPPVPQPAGSLPANKRKTSAEDKENRGSLPVKRRKSAEDKGNRSCKKKKMDSADGRKKKTSSADSQGKKETSGQKRKASSGDGQKKKASSGDGQKKKASSGDGQKKVSSADGQKKKRQTKPADKKDDPSEAILRISDPTFKPKVADDSKKNTVTLDSDASIQLDVSDNCTVDIEEPKSPSPSLEDSLQEPLSGESVGISESDPLHLELTVSSLENKVLVMEAKQLAMEASQRSILTKLKNIEQVVMTYMQRCPNPHEPPLYAGQVGRESLRSQDMLFHAREPWQAPQTFDVLQESLSLGGEEHVAWSPQPTNESPSTHQVHVRQLTHPLRPVQQSVGRPFHHNGLSLGSLTESPSPHLGRLRESPSRICDSLRESPSQHLGSFRKSPLGSLRESHSQPHGSLILSPSQHLGTSMSSQEKALHTSQNLPSIPESQGSSFESPLPTQPASKPFPIVRVNNPLPSSAISKDKLHSIAQVMQMFPKLKGEGKAPTLAVKLARKSLFGDDVLAQCTPGGGRGLPGLPVAELNVLKELLFKNFSQYWNNPLEFESRVWTPSFNAIGQACKRLRNP